MFVESIVWKGYNKYSALHREQIDELKHSRQPSIVKEHDIQLPFLR